MALWPPTDPVISSLISLIDRPDNILASIADQSNELVCDCK